MSQYLVSFLLLNDSFLIKKLLFGQRALNTTPTSSLLSWQSSTTTGSRQSIPSRVISEAVGTTEEGCEQEEFS